MNPGANIKTSSGKSSACHINDTYFKRRGKPEKNSIFSDSDVSSLVDDQIDAVQEKMNEKKAQANQLKQKALFLSSTPKSSKSSSDRRSNPGK